MLHTTRSKLFPYTTLFRSQGVEALMRVLIRFERWNTILEPGTLPWGATLLDKMDKSYCETLQGNVPGSKIVFHRDRKSTRLNSSHQIISYAVFCLKKKKQT